MSLSDRPRYDHLFIDGEWVLPLDGETAESIDPATGRGWATVAMGGPADVDRAVAAARAAYPGRRRTPGHVRAAHLRRLADLFQAALPELAAVESRDTGTPITDMRGGLAGQVQWYPVVGLARRQDPWHDRPVRRHGPRVPAGADSLLPTSNPLSSQTN